MSNPGPNVQTTVNLNQAGSPINPSASGAGDGDVLGKSASHKVGLWGATPVIQQALPAGNTATTAAGAGAAVKVDTSFTGGIGTTAYTVGDIVAALKTIGALG